MTHTPLPWRYTYNKKFDEYTIRRSDIVDRGQTTAIATMTYDALPGGEMQPKYNAELIVKAVNAHDDLVNALKLMIVQTEEYFINDLATRTLKKHGLI